MRLMHAALIAGLMASTVPGTAQAASDSTWVAASTGDDNNDCSYASPCTTFNRAIMNTNAKGIVTALEPGDYRGFVIDKSLTVVGVPGAVVNVPAPVVIPRLVQSISPSQTGTGIVVNANRGDRITILGLTLNGMGLGEYGIVVSGKAPDRLSISDCTITNFKKNAFRINQPSGNLRVMLRNSLVTNGGGTGLAISAQMNTSYGVVVKGTTFDLNGGYALDAAGSGTQVLMSQSRLLRSPQGVGLAGASLISYGDNILRNGDAPTFTIPTN